MTKNIADYLQYYIGCEVLYKGEIHFLSGVSRPYKTNDKTIPTFSVRPDKNGFRSTIYSLENFDDIRLILRRLSDMTKDEMIEWVSIGDGSPGISVNFPGGSYSHTHWLASDKTHWLLKNNFDLFGLIDSGLAIDKSTLK